MYYIDCSRASAAPLASASANKPDLLLSHKVLHRSNITRYYHRFKYIQYELATHVFGASIYCVIQFGTPNSFWGEYDHVIAVLLFTCSRRVVAWGQHVFAFRILVAPCKLLKCEPLRATVL